MSSRVDLLEGLTPEQRRQVTADAERLFHRDWDPWPAIFIYGMTLATTLVAFLFAAWWLPSGAPFAVLPILIMSLPLSRTRMARGQAGASAWKVFAYSLIAALVLIIAASSLGWVVLQINLISVGLEGFVLWAASQQGIKSYLPLARSGANADQKSDTIFERCPACGYAFDGLPRTTIRCPECGEVRIFPPDSRLGLGPRATNTTAAD